MIQAELKVVGGKHAGKMIPLPKGKFLIGREKDCHLRPSSELISRHHCVFNLDDYTVRLRDLGSTNGTLVNEKRLQGETVLSAGDHVVIGPLHFEVVTTEVSAEAAPTTQSMHDSGMLSEPGHSHATETAYELKMDSEQAVQPAPETVIASEADQNQQPIPAASQTVAISSSDQATQSGPLMPSSSKESKVPSPPIKLPDPEETGVRD
ncbi:FHA domain-containing protein [Calycomorphotria hydatis]|uniref:FHA domain protein n=1 Tax=Calycomorphotria hydatis TaxID=2528027 RepID=A0A517TAN9_9PLAN|nr:FHA domain-containing protein [Calycomorphotria hydatis]QDT65435.1 FHA domain protein [Calycomorphotria hydatis]